MSISWSDAKDTPIRWRPKTVANRWNPHSEKRMCSMNEDYAQSTSTNQWSQLYWIQQSMCMNRQLWTQQHLTKDSQDISDSFHIKCVLTDLEFRETFSCCKQV
jgi:hypothetical protein